MRVAIAVMNGTHAESPLLVEYAVIWNARSSLLPSVYLAGEAYGRIADNRLTAASLHIQNLIGIAMHATLLAFAEAADSGT